MRTPEEWSLEFDLLYNNITSNQAPGLTEYEKSVFLTRAQEEIVKDYFSGKTNTLGEGFDDSERRQYDFSTLVETEELDSEVTPGSVVPDALLPDNASVLDKRSGNAYYIFPSNVLLVLNEVIVETVGTGSSQYDIQYQVVPISYAEYARLMKKPYKYPAKGLAWRLITGTGTITGSNDEEQLYKRIEIIARFKNASSPNLTYYLRYVKMPEPIILQELEETDPSINESYDKATCKLPEALHNDILVRAVNLAKIAWLDTVAPTGKQ